MWVREGSNDGGAAKKSTATTGAATALQPDDACGNEWLTPDGQHACGQVQCAAS